VYVSIFLSETHLASLTPTNEALHLETRVLIFQSNKKIVRLIYFQGRIWQKTDIALAINF